MTESGKVIKTNGRHATVKVDKKDECSKCGLCLFPKNATAINFRSINDIGAKEGDEVLIKTSPKAKTLGVFLAFGMPLILIIACIVIGYFLFKKELFILLLAVGVTIVWYTALAFIDKKLKKSSAFLTEIIEITNKGD